MSALFIESSAQWKGLEKSTFKKNIGFRSPRRNQLGEWMCQQNDPFSNLKRNGTYIKHPDACEFNVVINDPTLHTLHTN